jgi:hypothetical protein
MAKTMNFSWIVVLSSLMLFVAGCDSGSEGPSGAPTTPYLGGGNGLEIGFLEGNPPTEVTDGGTFPFQAVVKLKNVGEDQISPGEISVRLIGFEPGQFNSEIIGEQFTGEDLVKGLSTPLDGRRKDAEGNIIEPIETFLTFPTDNKNFKYSGNVQGNTIFIFRADVCYLYQTKARSELCILQNQIDRAKNAICNPTESKTVFSSGSPVKVEGLRQNVAGSNKLQFSFDVTHSGSGNLFDSSSGVSCPKNPTERRTNEGKVKVTVDTRLTTGYNLNCVGLIKDTVNLYKASGTLKLVNGKRTVTCTLDLPTTRNDFRNPIDVIVDYNYAQSSDKEVLVKHIIS